MNVPSVSFVLRLAHGPSLADRLYPECAPHRTELHWCRTGCGAMEWAIVSATHEGPLDQDGDPLWECGTCGQMLAVAMEFD